MRFTLNIIVAFLWCLSAPLDATFAQTSWAPTAGPYGGLVCALTIDTQGRLFAATPNGVFTSTDDGGQWSGKPLPPSDRSSVLAIIAAALDAVLAGTADGHVFRSIDHGASWTLVYTLPGSGTITGFCTSGQTVFMSVNSTSSGAGGLYRSSDGGISWAISAPSSVTVNSLAISPTTNTVIAATWAGIYRTLNNGLTWASYNTGIPIPTKFAHSVASSPSGVMYAALSSYSDNSVGQVSGAVFISTNDGASWSARINGLIERNMMRVFAPADGLVFSSNQNGNIHRSVDQGLHWIPCDSVNASVTSYAFNPANRLLFLGSGKGVFRSTDSGASWIPSSKGLMNAPVTSLIRDTGMAVLCGVNIASRTSYGSGTVTLVVNIFGGGLYRTTNGGDSWEVPTGARGLPDIVGMTRTPNGDLYALTVFDGVYRSTDHAATWTRIPTGYSYLTGNAIASNDSGHVFVAMAYAPSSTTVRSALIRTNTEGLAWFTVLDNMIIRSIAVGNAKDVYAASYTALFRSSDNGYGWGNATNPPGNNYHMLAFDRSRGRLYAGKQTALSSSSDKGTTWTTIEALGQNTSSWSMLALGDTLFTSNTVDGTHVSSDRGGSWTQFDTGLNGNILRDIVLDPSWRLLGGSSAGVYRTTSAVPVDLITFDAMADGGNVRLSWLTIRESNSLGFSLERAASGDDDGWIPIAFIRSHAPGSGPSEYSYLDQHAPGGIRRYRLLLVEADGSRRLLREVQCSVNDQERDSELYQNHPNPFDRQTIMRYRISNMGHVRVEVCDLLGKRITTLVDEEQAPGVHAAVFDVHSCPFKVPAGLYYYRITTPSAIMTKLMVLR
jgi:photosystem II stability/assembly factor-like uncharacterized protein